MRRWAPAVVLAVAACAPVVAGEPYQGFGSGTPGGAGQPVVHVTTLEDSGPGSLREALLEGGRTVVFDVAGEITLASHVFVGGPYVTIDGTSAPRPGITLRNRGLVVRGNRGAHDVIVRGLRVRDSLIDGIQVAYGAYNIVIDHVSIDGSADGNIDITENSHDVTVSWSVLSGNHKNMLVKFLPARVSLHHNAFVESSTRNPQVRIDEEGTLASETTVDFRNNVVANWQGYGTLIWEGARANVVNNYFTASTDALQIRRASAWTSGNVSGDGAALDGRATSSAPFEAPPVDTQEACAAARAVIRGVGVRPLDVRDQQLLARVLLRGCPGG